MAVLIPLYRFLTLLSVGFVTFILFATVNMRATQLAPVQAATMLAERGR